MSDTELTESKFNDILQSMWMAGIKVPSMTFNIHESMWHFVEDWVGLKGFSSTTWIYDSDFGKVFLHKVK